MAKAMYVGVKPALPNGYTQVEYIESTGTQYINADVRANKNTRVVMEVSMTAFPTASESSVCLFGGYDSAVGRFSMWADSNGSMTYNYCTGLNQITTLSRGEKAIIDCNKNVCTINGVSKTVSQTNFSNTYDLFLFASNYTGNANHFAKMKLYSCKIYDNGTLVRDFVPAVNALGLKGLFDLVSNKFRMNVGEGNFLAGKEVDGIARNVIKPYIGVNGVARKVVRAYIGDANGKARLFWSSGTPVGSLAMGSIVKIPVNGVSKDFIVVHQGLPSSAYDSSCNGTWLLMKDVYESRQWHSTERNSYYNSDIHTYLNETFLNLFDADIRAQIKTVKVPYVSSRGSTQVASGSSGLSTQIFLLSGYEVGFTNSSYTIPIDGACLDYFNGASNADRIAYEDGTATKWCLRTAHGGNAYMVWFVRVNGGVNSGNTTDNFGIRPALILPSEILVDDNGTVLSRG